MRYPTPRTDRVPCRLLILAKEPVAGRVKTRLCPPFTPVQAAELASAALADTLAAVFSAVARQSWRGVTVEPVLVLEGRPGPWLEGLLEGPTELPVIAQRAGGLGARIAGAFEDALAPLPGYPVSGADCALLVGMDTPQLSSRLLSEAIDALRRPGSDAVLGLADDGGWWAMGLRTADDSLLLGVPMSSPETGQIQYDQLLASGLSVTLLPGLRDVDTAGDAEAAALLAPRSRFAATLAALAPSGPVALPACG
jgi:uncharacterized protein